MTPLELVLFFVTTLLTLSLGATVGSFLLGLAERHQCADHSQTHLQTEQLQKEQEKQNKQAKNQVLHQAKK